MVSVYPPICVSVPYGTCFRFDELHPSEQADRVVAKQISEVILGEENKWTTWFS